MLVLFNGQAKLRLHKWYISLFEKEKKKITREIIALILAKRIPSSNFLDYKDYKIVYQR